MLVLGITLLLFKNYITNYKKLQIKQKFVVNSHLVFLSATEVPLKFFAIKNIK